MFLTLLVVTFFIALIVSSIVARIFAKPIDDILKRIINDTISSAWGPLSSICHLRGGDFEWRAYIESRELRKSAAKHRPPRIDAESLGARSVSHHYREPGRTGMGIVGVFCSSADRVRHS
jgi:hypothetical protein